jgi:cation diffusion facilitator CzcD-associated flavoprotein CzcO
MTAPLPTGSTRVLVVGAGQAALAVVHSLARLGLSTAVAGAPDAATDARSSRPDVVLVDRAPGPGGAWQFRWEALRLGAAHRVHDLPGMAEMGLHFADADPDRPAKDVVAEYYGRYEAHHGIVVHRPVAVIRVTDAGGDLLATLRGPDGGTTTLRAAVLVNASGTWGAPFVPWYPGRDTFAGRQLDTTGYRSAEEFRGQDVVVVGGGTSAIGFVLELDGVAASVTWCTRRPVDWGESASLDSAAAIAAVAEQDAAARAGVVLPSIVHGTAVPISPGIRRGLDRGVLHPRPVFTRVESDGVRFADGSVQHADAIIWATGFRPDVRHLGPLGLREAAGGIAVEGGVSVRDPRVFLAGYGPQASTIGADRAGRAIARRIVARLRGAADTPRAS